MVLFIILMGMFGWETYARLARGVVLSATAQPYAKAVRRAGRACRWRLYLRHILPNVASALIVQVTLTFPADHPAGNLAVASSALASSRR